MCVILCLFSALSRRVGALEISFIIIINAATLFFSFPYKAEGRSLNCLFGFTSVSLAWYREQLSAEVLSIWLYVSFIGMVS